jgi:hypothetical protein
MAAAERIRPVVMRRLEVVMRDCIAHGDSTCDETEVRTRVSHQTVSARYRQAFLAGLVSKPEGVERPTRSGYPAQVYTPTILALSLYPLAGDAAMSDCHSQQSA